MNAQEAAKTVHSGMDKLSLSELMEVRSALKNDAEVSSEFNLVNLMAKSVLGNYAHSTRETQSKMTREDATALHELVDLYGWDDQENLTEDGKKALEIVARVSKRENDGETLDSKPRREGTLLTQAQKDILDYHGFMYGETLESLGKFQNYDEALKVLRDEGVLNNDKKAPKAAAEKGLKEFKGTPLTKEQIRILDEHGFMHNGTLESLGLYKNYKEVEKILKDEGAPASKPLKPMFAKFEDDNTDDLTVNEAGLVAAQINKNMEQLDRISSSINVLDENDKRFADSRDNLGILHVTDKEGNELDVRSGLISLAKLQTEKDLHDAKKVTEEAYVERLKLNIDVAVLSIIQCNQIDFSNYNGNEALLRKNLEQSLDVFKKDKKTGKPGKAEVKFETVLSYMAVKSNELNKFSDKLSEKFKTSTMGEKFRAKIKAIDTKGEKIFGEKNWKYARGAAAVADNASMDIFMAGVAGFGGPIGLGVFAAYTFNKRVMPFIKSYTDQPMEKRSGLWDYAAKNKKEATKAALYTVAFGLSATTAVVQGIASVTAAVAATNAATTATAMTASSSIETAVVNHVDFLTKYLSHTRAAVSGATMLFTNIVNVGEKMQGGDKKAIKRSIWTAIGSTAAFVGGYALRSLIGAEHADGKNTPVENSTADNASRPFVDKDGDGISDYVDRDGGDGSANPAPAPEVIFDDYYHGAEVAGKSHESVIRLLTNGDVSRSDATLRAEMMISRVGGMDEEIRASFPSASDAQIAHAILLRASDVHKGDADELLRALLGDENCRKLTMEQQVSEIHKGLTGYNYGQRSDLPFGRNLDPNYTGMNTRSRFLLDDCESERLTDRFGNRSAGIKPVVALKIDTVDINVDDTEVELNPRPIPEKTEVRPISEKTTVTQPVPVTQEVTPAAVDPLDNFKSPNTGKPFVYNSHQSGAIDMRNDMLNAGAALHNDGTYRYVDYETHDRLLRSHGFSSEEAKQVVNHRIETEKDEFIKQRALRERGSR